MAENITAEQEVYEVDKLTLLDCKKIRLAKEESGFLTLDYEGRTYHKVNPTKAHTILLKDHLHKPFIRKF